MSSHRENWPEFKADHRFASMIKTLEAEFPSPEAFLNSLKLRQTASFIEALQAELKDLEAET